MCIQNIFVSTNFLSNCVFSFLFVCFRFIERQHDVTHTQQMPTKNTSNRNKSSYKNC